MAQGDILSIIKNRPFNAIINGAMDYWQRGTSFNFLATSGYTADRFVGFDTNISRQSFVTGQTDVPNNPKYFMRSDNTGRTGSFGGIVQRIEDISTVAGKQKTFSVYMNTSVNSTIYFRSWYNFGAGSTTSARPSAWIPINLTIGWKRYTVTVDFPPILASDDLRSGNYAEATLDLYVSGASGSSLGYTTQGLTPPTYVGQLDLSNVMLSDGPMAPEFERSGVSLANELQLCQRYFEKSYDIDTPPATPNSIGGRFYATVNSAGRWSVFSTFKVQKRSYPILVVYSPVTGNSNNYYDASTGLQRPIGSVEVGEWSCSLTNWNGNTTTASGRILIHWTADAEL